jgi:hypothetical protein
MIDEINNNLDARDDTISTVFVTSTIYLVA